MAGTSVTPAWEKGFTARLIILAIICLFTWYSAESKCLLHALLAALREVVELLENYVRWYVLCRREAWAGLRRDTASRSGDGPPGLAGRGNL